MTKKTFLVILVFTGVFVCGGVVGGAVAFGNYDRFVERKGANRFSVMQLRELAEKLALTAEQRDRARVILERSLKDRQESQRQMQVINDRMKEDLNSLLTPEQKAKHKEILAKQRASERQWIRGMRERREGFAPVGPDGKPLPMPPHFERRERDRSSETGRPPDESTPPPPPSDGAGPAGRAP